MEIKGPLIISVHSDDTPLTRELHLSFKPAFIQQNVSHRLGELQNHMIQLTQQMRQMNDDDPNRSGMETILQICANLMEYVRGDEIDLNETIVIETQPTVNIVNFITGQYSIN